MPTSKRLGKSEPKSESESKLEPAAAPGGETIRIGHTGVMKSQWPARDLGPTNGACLLSGHGLPVGRRLAREPAVSGATVCCT